MTKRKQYVDLIDAEDYDDINELMRKIYNFSNPVYIYGNEDSENLFLISTHELSSEDIEIKFDELIEQYEKEDSDDDFDFED